jgi:hypothetical protein
MNAKYKQNIKYPYNGIVSSDTKERSPDHAPTWLHLKNILLSERWQTQMIP